MNRDDIIRMAREVADKDKDDPYHAGEPPFIVLTDEELERFAALVAAHVELEPCCQEFDKCQQICMPRAKAAEREACAKLAEDPYEFTSDEAHRIANAIRARGENP